MDHVLAGMQVSNVVLRTPQRRVEDAGDVKSGAAAASLAPHPSAGHVPSRTAADGAKRAAASASAAASGAARPRASSAADARLAAPRKAPGTNGQ